MKTQFALFSLFLLLALPLSQSFTQTMLQKYLPAGSASKEQLDLLNSRAVGTVPQKYFSFLKDSERINLIVSSNTGNQELASLKVETKKSGGKSLLTGISTGRHENPTIAVSGSEAAFERIYNAKDEVSQFRKELNSGNIKITFPKDFFRGFIWAFTLITSQMGNAIGV